MQLIRDALAADRARWPLWLPIAFAVGIGGYFALPWEPPYWVALAGPIPVVAAAWLMRGRDGPLWLSLFVLFAVFGAATATLRTAGVDTAMLTRPLWATVDGTVVGVERRPDDTRLTLEALSIAALRLPEDPPERVRVVLRRPGALQIGDRVRLRARLSPPPPPTVPGGFDFQRRAYFAGLGAVGFAIGDAEILSTDGRRRWSLAVDGLRARIAARLTRALPGSTGAVAAALIVGDRAGLDEATSKAFRDSGLAHLLAISGLHMGLVAGTVFAALRLILCLVPGTALHWPVKKVAASLALAVSAAYLVLAGAPVPTQRAFLMTAAVLAAVLVDREAVTLRLVALAGFAVLVLRPDSLVSASFQLSFAAVIALVAAHEMWRRKRRGGGGAFSWGFAVVRYIVGVASTSLIASLATAPFVTYHFQAIALGGIVANLLAVPLTAFVTMPAGIAALLIMPFGAEGWILPAMGAGIEATLAIADRAVALTGPAASVYPLPPLGLAAIALGGCWVAIWRTGMRWLGIVPVAAGAAGWLTVVPPDALISADGRLSAVSTEGAGGWAVSNTRGHRFARSVWARRWGVSDTVTLTAYDRIQGARPSPLSCDDLGCTLRRNGLVLSLITAHEAALEDCRTADVLIAVVRLRTACEAPRVVIHRPDLWTAGAHAIWLGPKAVRVATVLARRGRRPWVLRSTSD